MMAWFKVDDSFHTSRKVKSIPARQRFAAVGLWTVAGSWCSQELTDGHVPDYMIREWGVTTKVVDALVESGLWERTREGFTFCSWSEYNPTKARVRLERAASKARTEASRERWRNKTAGSDGAGGVVAAQHHGNTNDTLQRPDPTRPDPTQKEEKTSSPATPPMPKYPAPFEAFWAVYPRKTGKGQALKAWEKARRKIGDQPLIDAATAFAADPNLPEVEFIPHAATWLNGCRWDDGPLPTRGTTTRHPDEYRTGWDELLTEPNRQIGA